MADPAQEIHQMDQTKTMDDDKELVAAAKKDVEAFGKLYDKYYDAITRYIYYRTRDRNLTEDLTSNTFLSAFTHIDRFRWKRISFGAWLYRIATNEINMCHRRRGQSPTISLQTHNPTDLRTINKLQNDDLPAGEKLVDEENHVQLHGAILQLKPIYQTVIVLRYFDQKSIAEIAAITGKREGTIKSQIHRALKQLETHLSEHSTLNAE